MAESIGGLIENTAFSFATVERRRRDLLTLTAQVTCIIAAVPRFDATRRTRASGLRISSALSLTAIRWLWEFAVSAGCAVVFTTVPDQNASLIAPTTLGRLNSTKALTRWGLFLGCGAIRIAN